MSLREKIFAHWSKATLILGFLILVLLIVYFNAIQFKFWLLWFSLFLYSLHQFEEHAYPGHFKETMNKILSGTEESPMTDGDVFFINIFYVWILGPIFILLSPVSAIFPSCVLIMIITNTALHIGQGIRLRKYNPGLAFSIFANLPVALYAAILFFESMSAGDIAIAVVGGILLHATVFMYIMAKRRKVLKSAKE
jgi:hypothetical protein